MALNFPTNYATMVIDNGWQTINGEKYYLKDSVIVKGLQEIGGETYYFDNKGIMQTGLQKTPEERFFGEDGTEQEGVQDKNGNLILYLKDGRASKGWHNLNGKKYYVGVNRYLTVGLETIDNDTYFFNKDGVMQTGWQKTPAKRYFKEDGKMVKGEQNIEGITYMFADNGTLYQGLLGNKYYNEDGSVFIGKKTVHNLTIETDEQGNITSKHTATGLAVVNKAKQTKGSEKFIEEVYSSFGAEYDKDGKLKSAGDYVSDAMCGDIVVFKDKDGYRIDKGVYIGENLMVNAEDGKETPFDKDRDDFVGYFRHDFLKKDLTQYAKY